MKSPVKLALKILFVLFAVGIVIGFRTYSEGIDEGNARKALEGMKVLVTPDANGHVQGIAFLPNSQVDLKAALSHARDLPYLEVLRFSGAEVSDEHLALVGECTSLKSIDLSGTGVSDEGVKHLNGLNNLESIYLTNTEVTEACLPALGQCKALIILNLSGTKVVGDLRPLVSLNNLQHLLVAGSPIGNHAAESLAMMKSLNRLSMQKGQFSGTELEKIQQAHLDLKIDIQ